jgi:hypothetical protein
MNGFPGTRPQPTDPGGFQARADGQQVEVRTYEGELIRNSSANGSGALGRVPARRDPQALRSAKGRDPLAPGAFGSNKGSLRP